MNAYSSALTLLATACYLALTAAALAVVVVEEEGCNCPGAGGNCIFNCSSVSDCCGYRTKDPSCLAPGEQCCLWYDSSIQCSAEESCCGELGYGPSSSAFCCGPDTTCCATSEDGVSSCCAAGQQCCGGYNTFCCDAEAEVCGPNDSMICLPKHPITRNPHAKPGDLEWAVSLGTTWSVHAPVRVNDSFVVVSGGRGTGTALVRLSDGAVTIILPASTVAPTVTGGRVFVSTFDQLASYDLKRGDRSWSATFYASAGVGLVGQGHYLFAASSLGLSLFDARNGSILYTVPFTYPLTKPVISAFGTVAFTYFNAFLVFRLDTGKVLVNATTGCYNPPPPLLTGSLFISCNLVAYSARSGKQVWAAATSVQALSMAATTKTVAVAPEGTQELYMVTKADGTLVKKVSLNAPYSQSIAVTATASELLASYGNITAVNGTTGAMLWNYSSAQYSFESTASGAVHGGYVYLQATTETYPAAMVAVHAATGLVARSWGAGGLISTPLFVDGRLLFMSADGFLYCINTL